MIFQALLGLLIFHIRGGAAKRAASFKKARPDWCSVHTTSATGPVGRVVLREQAKLDAVRRGPFFIIVSVL